MGLIEKKDEHELVDGVEVIERSDVPEDLPEPEVELVEGDSAEDIAAEPAADAETDDVDSDDADEPASDAQDADDDVPPVDSDGACASDGSACPRKNLFIAIAVIAVIVAAIGGYFIGHGGFGAKGAGSATLTEGQLDTVVATWSYNGATKNLTAREAIEAQYSLDAAKNDDGTYNAPSAELVTAYVRNQILLAEADARGLSASDEERDEYAESQLGTADYEMIASQFGVSEDQAKQIVAENATIAKLYQEIVPESSATMPEAPAEPEGDDTTAVTKDYADYIIKLAGDEWDAEAGTWASKDGAYAQALSASTTFSAEGASYEDAQTAYYVAYQQYAQEAQETQGVASSFINGLYAKANVTLYGIYV